MRVIERPVKIRPLSMVRASTWSRASPPSPSSRQGRRVVSYKSRMRNRISDRCIVFSWDGYNLTLLNSERARDKRVAA